MFTTSVELGAYGCLCGSLLILTAGRGSSWDVEINDGDRIRSLRNGELVFKWLLKGT